MRFEPVNSRKELRQHLAEEILRKRAIFISTKLSAGLITAQHKNMSLVPPALQMSRQTGPEISEHILLSVLVGKSAQAAITETTGWGWGGSTVEVYFLTVPETGSPRSMESVGRFGFSEASLFGLQIYSLSPMCAPIPVFCVSEFLPLTKGPVRSTEGPLI